MWNTTNDRQAFWHIHSSPPTDAFSPSSSPPSSRLSSGSHTVLFFFICIMIYCIKCFLKISTLTNKKFIFVYEIADFFIEIFSFKLCWMLSPNSYWLLVSNLCLSKNLHNCCKVFPDITTIVGAERIFILLESCPAWNDQRSRDQLSKLFSVFAFICNIFDFFLKNRIQVHWDGIQWITFVCRELSNWFTTSTIVFKLFSVIDIDFTLAIIFHMHLILSLVL